LHPYSNLTCISSWYICIPNIIWIHLTITEKMNGNCHYQECDGRKDGGRTGRTSPYHNTSRFQLAYKNGVNTCQIFSEKKKNKKRIYKQGPLQFTSLKNYITIWLSNKTNPRKTFTVAHWETWFCSPAQLALVFPCSDNL
jgi:hypothetical protein